MKGLQRMQFRIAYSTAVADGELTPSEEQVLDILARAYGFDAEEKKRLEEQSSRLDLQSLRAVVPLKKDRLALLEAACLVAMADGVAQPEEWKLTVDLCLALDIGREEAQTCVRRARRELIRLARRYGMEGDLKANLRKAGILK